MKSECAHDVFVDVAAEVRLEVAHYFLFIAQVVLWDVIISRIIIRTYLLTI